jgi:hypothetical protein
MVRCVLGEASEYVVKHYLQEKEMVSWIDFPTMLISDSSEDPKWIQNGTQQNYNCSKLNAIVVTLGHVKFIPIVLERGLLSAVAEFSKARKPPNMPD